MKNRLLVKTKFAFSELGGAFGDWGTLIPFVIGYISILGFSPAGIFLSLGITNILLGFRFDLPLPVQPQKTISTAALAEHWSISRVISTGFGTGVIWLILGSTKILNNIIKHIPFLAVRGIQLGLAIILGVQAISYIADDLLLGEISLLIILLLIKSRKVSSALVLTVIGIVYMSIRGFIVPADFAFSLPEIIFELPSLAEIWWGMMYAGFAQLFLTLTNVMIATVVLAQDLFPDRKAPLNSDELALNMGLMNIASPFIGGIPLCHGSGGLAAQYAFGARTGGSMIYEGIIEIIFGLFFSEGLLALFTNFPVSIFGAMLLYTAFLLGKISFKERKWEIVPIILITATLCYFFSVTVGFLSSLLMIVIYNQIVVRNGRKYQLDGQHE